MLCHTNGWAAHGSVCCNVHCETAAASGNSVVLPLLLLTYNSSGKGLLPTLLLLQCALCYKLVAADNNKSRTCCA